MEVFTLSRGGTCRDLSRLVSALMFLSVPEPTPLQNFRHTERSLIGSADTTEAQLKQIVKEAVRLLDLALLPCHRREAPELFDVERCARLLGAFESNLLSVEVECPAIAQLREPPHDSQIEPESRSKLQKSVKPGTGSRCTLLYPQELLARASQAVSTAASTAAAEDATLNTKKTKTMRCSRKAYGGQDIGSGDDVSGSMLSSSWPCSEGVGL